MLFYSMKSRFEYKFFQLGWFVEKLQSCLVACSLEGIRMNFHDLLELMTLYEEAAYTFHDLVLVVVTWNESLLKFKCPLKESCMNVLICNSCLYS